MKKLDKGKKKRVFDRYTAIFVVMLLVFSGILAKLSVLQVVKADDYKDKANQKGTREIPQFAPRGKILDRNNIVLADNKNSYILIYNESEDSSKEFFPTMTKVFGILNDKGETFKDDFELKSNPFRFEFKADDDKVKKDLELRFKKDRGLDDPIKKKLFPKKDKLSDDEQLQVDNQLLKITPEQVFYGLVKDYQLYKLLGEGQYSFKQMADMDGKKLTDLLLKKYTIDDIRKYLVVKDTIKMQSFSGYKPVIVASNINEKTSFIFLQELNDLPGIDVTTQPLRKYPYHEVGSAFLGYISKINGGVSDKYEEKGYDTSSDYVGMAGLESAFEDRLKGSKGGQIVKLNSQGRIIQELGRRESYPGQNIQLTIDKNVQEVAEKALDDTMKELQSWPTSSDGTNTGNATRGAAVVIDVNTGGIIALASRPGYDPNFFSTPGAFAENKDVYNKLFNSDLASTGQQYIESRGLDTSKVAVDSLFPIDTRASTDKKTIRYDKYDILPKPMYNYATMGFTQPGSTFKPLTAIAGLEEGAIDAHTVIEDKGIYTKNNFNGKCWIYADHPGQTHGAQTVTLALQNSCNYFFFDVGDRLMGTVNDVKSDTLAKYAWKFGLGVDPKGNAKKSTGIEIAENFGSTSNLEYIKGQVTFYKINEMIAAIGKMNLDLVVHENDSEDVRTLKNTILDECKKRMIDKSGNGNEFFNGLKTQIKKLNGSLTNGDVSSIAIKMDQYISDGNGEIYTPANVYNAAIGQGYSRFTPLQMADYMATVVNGGKRYKLHLVDKFIDPNGTILEQVKPEVLLDVKLKQSTVDTVIEGMKKVTESGTASSTFQGFPITNGGKTGSATFQNNQHDYGREAFGVYVGFAPLENPKIAVCIVVYDGAHGNNVAPVARAIYETYFRDDILAGNPNYQFMYPIIK